MDMYQNSIDPVLFTFFQSKDVFSMCVKYIAKFKKSLWSVNLFSPGSWIKWFGISIYPGFTYLKGDRETNFHSFVRLIKNIWKVRNTRRRLPQLPLIYKSFQEALTNVNYVMLYAQEKMLLCHMSWATTIQR